MDESFLEHPVAGFYVLAAALFDGDEEQAREAMLELRAPMSPEKLHWTQMGPKDRQQAVEVVSSLAGLHLVTVGAPVPQRRQERARALSLRRLVFELHGAGVTRVMVEARPDNLNRRDVETVRAARHDLPRGTELHIEHKRGSAEPLFWIADIVAGAVRAERTGTAEYRSTLGAAVEVIDLSPLSI